MHSPKKKEKESRESGMTLPLHIAISGRGRGAIRQRTGIVGCSGKGRNGKIWRGGDKERGPTLSRETRATEGCAKIHQEGSGRKKKRIAARFSTSGLLGNAGRNIPRKKAVF